LKDNQSTNFKASNLKRYDFEPDLVRKVVMYFYSDGKVLVIELYDEKGTKIV
jgi:hypothetical protein